MKTDIHIINMLDRKSRLLLPLFLLFSISLPTCAQSLKDAYRDYFKVGVAMNYRNFCSKPDRELVLQEFNSVTCENEMKPASVHPAEGVWHWEQADSIANFCRRNHIKLRGHCLCWHNQFCDWMFVDKQGQPVTKEVFYKRLREHIHTVVRRYKDIVYCWDVVNEAMSDGGDNPYRDSRLYQLCGDEFIAKAFQFAHEADKKALLFYNDYNAFDKRKCKNICEMVQKMKKAGVPIDGVGLQGHYNIFGPEPEQVDAALTQYAKVVKHLQVTELDMRANMEMGGQLQHSQQGVEITDEVKERQAERYARLFEVFRRHKDNLEVVTFWNVCDRDSWLGVNNYPLLFDKNLQRKAAYYAVRDFKENNHFSINLDKRLQTNEGWGVSLCWWAKECGKWPEERLDSLVEWLVSPNGLNYNIFRYNIGGGDDPQNANCTAHHMGAPGGKGLRAEMDGFQDAEGAAYDWSRDEGQRRIMLMIKQKRPDAIFEAFSNSAPWWMTVSGCCAGAKDANEDNLRTDKYEAFAHYLVDVCKHYRDAYGIEFRTLDPFNEPVTNYWFQNGGQEGCHVSTEAQVAFLKVIAPMLKASGLKTQLSASDETAVGQSILDLREYDKEGVLPLVGQWNTHTYKGSRQQKVQLRQLADSLHIRLWQSETGDGGRGLQGNLKMAQRLVDDIRYLQPSAWCDWQYVEENFDQWSLVKCDHEWGNYERHKNYYVRCQFSRFIPSGYTWVQVDDPHGLAALSADGKTLVYVTLNMDKHSREVSVTLPKGAKLECAYRTSRTENCSEIALPSVKDEQLMLSLPSRSIETIIMNLK